MNSLKEKPHSLLVGLAGLVLLRQKRLSTKAPIPSSQAGVRLELAAAGKGRSDEIVTGIQGGRVESWRT